MDLSTFRLATVIYPGASRGSSQSTAVGAAFRYHISARSGSIGTQRAPDSPGRAVASSGRTDRGALVITIEPMSILAQHIDMAN